MRKFQLLFTTLASLLLLARVTFEPKSGNLKVRFSNNSAAYAISSGGRSRGGSFSSPSSPSRPLSSPSRLSSPPSSPRRSTSSPSQNRPSPSRPLSSPSRLSSPSSSPRRPTSSFSQNRPTNGSHTGGRDRGGSFQNQPSPSLKPYSPPVPRTLYTPSPKPYSPPVPRTLYTPSPKPYSPPVPRTLYTPSPKPYSPPVPRTLYTPSPTVTQPNPSGGSTGIVPLPAAPSPYYFPANPVQTPYYSPPAPSVSQPPTYKGSGYSSNSNNSTSSSHSFWSFLLFLFLSGGAIFCGWFILIFRNKNNQSDREPDNDIVTVSKLQIALLAEAHHIQSYLSNLTVSADLETPKGRVEFLQESALALLRAPEYWSHVLASSQTLENRATAEQLFEKLSIEERRKFDTETLVNVNGRIRTRSPGNLTAVNKGIAAYIVVTFLVGTEDDKPLFGNIDSADQLKQSLTRVAAISPDYLLIFELLWSPQVETDSLTYDELLTEYADMIEIA